MEPAWSLVLSPSVLFSSNEISINMLDENDEKDTPAECVRQKMLWSQINSPQFKFCLASYKPVSCQICSVHTWMYVEIVHTQKSFLFSSKEWKHLKKKHKLTLQNCESIKILWKYHNGMEKSAKELLETISLLQRAIGTIIPWKKETKDSINLEVNTKLLPEQKMAITQQFSNNFIKVMYSKKNNINTQESKSLKRKLHAQIPHPKTNSTVDCQT